MTKQISILQSYVQLLLFIARTLSIRLLSEYKHMSFKCILQQ